MKNNKSYFKISDNEAGKRLDVFLMENCPRLSRSRIQNLIKDGLVEVRGRQVKANYRVKPDDEICLEIPPPEEILIIPEDIPLDILYEDNDLLVINKPTGMVVHPASGCYSGTLVNALLFHCKSLSKAGGKMRSGIVHRLDKDTSGILVAAKNDFSHLSLSVQFKNRTVKREYYAVVHGVLKEEWGTIDAPIGRHPKDRKRMTVTEGKVREAVTHFEVLERFSKYSLLKIKLETGRTHQIRVHMAYIHHPVLGDSQYGPKKKRYNLPGQVLHAALLGFVHPRTSEYMEFSAPLPESFCRILNRLREDLSFD